MTGGLITTVAVAQGIHQKLMSAIGYHLCPPVCLFCLPVCHKGPLTDFSKRSRSAKFRLVPKFKKDKNNKNKETCATLSLPGGWALSLSVSLTLIKALFLCRGVSCLSDAPPVGVSVHQWGTEEVGAWLDFLCLTEYKDIFIGHDVQGAELIHLERRDLKVLLLAQIANC